ncbi:hypothetical protein FRC12_024939 [Ceratobasidium sp. 428]|nr:hypothetical protein FRC12_024939 [Ceratobasidium sp. 428]
MSGYDIDQPPPPPLPPSPPDWSPAGWSEIAQEYPGLPSAYSHPPPPPRPHPSPRWALKSPGSRFSTGHYGSRTCGARLAAIDITRGLDTIRSYYRIVFALVRGSDHRPSLPVELVISICKYAEFISPVINRSLSDHTNCSRFPCMPRIICCYAGKPPPRILHTAIRTGPLLLPDLRALGEVTITIQFRKSSYWERESFFIKIHRGVTSSEVINGPNSSEMVWPCFESENLEVGGHTGPGPAFRAVEFSQCRIIDKSHEIWDFFQPGDQLEVAQRGESGDLPQNKGFEVTVCVRNRWEPTPAMLALAR